MDYRVKYLIRSAVNYFEKRKCPNCGSTEFEKEQRKYGVTLLLRCKQCGLKHRHPKDKKEWLEKFYQSEYQIDVHMMTHMPADTELDELKKKNFPGQRCYKEYLEALFPGQSDLKIVDFGSSWGYDVYNLLSYGYDAIGYELSKPRVTYGREKLGVPLVYKEEEIRDNNDIIFSSHVIEHLYSIADFVKLSREKLKDDGIFMAFCPNGNSEYRVREPEIFKANWGSVHPFYLDYEFAAKFFRSNPYLLLTGDWEFNYDEIKQWDQQSQVIGNIKDGKELLIIAKPNTQIRT